MVVERCADDKGYKGFLNYYQDQPIKNPPPPHSPNKYQLPIDRESELGGGDTG